MRVEELVTRLAELLILPRLIVLASCQSAGDGDARAAGGPSVQSSLAVLLADVGVPALIAMQGDVTMKTVEEMMPVFFAELGRDGQIDRAMAVARGRVRDRPDFWMPALYTRLHSGRIWYTPGFRHADGAQVWRNLLRPMQGGKVVPILGPGLLDPITGSWSQAARHMAGAFAFPLADHVWDDLPRVAQYLQVKQSRFNVVSEYKERLVQGLIAQHRRWLPDEALPGPGEPQRLGRLLATVGEHARQADEASPFKVLARLPASVYVTTNFDPLLTQALKAEGREPQRLVSRWRYQRASATSYADPQERPSAHRPLVYHALGAFGADGDDSLVLTEDDYFDYLIETATGRLMPPRVESALVDNSLIFLGFRLTDWSFRALFRLMMSLPGRERLMRYCHVAVQLDPDLQGNEDVEGTKAYLSEYFGQEANIDIFWGSAADFLTALHRELERGGRSQAPEQDEGGGDADWDF